MNTRIMIPLLASLFMLQAAEFKRRLHHLHAAAENLHAAGRHEQAEALRRETRRTERQWREGRSHRRPHTGQDLRPLAEAVGQLTQEMRELKRIINDLRERVDKPRQDGE